ncbi:hypothetical protein SAMN04515671_0901 [Nakamurella panacisegetis]|uniref:Uncharacterized protein n=1 Tax=Nakamurella panacisegetis TaxID=1090615 RepID=A0A1H0JFS1_9ACTN|nr:hypothetical protein [Nakamurella panacisegetis]SDO42546.1 hypothetical protein SAMN04515671_0901 [Nakamurella panacisegetis]
MTVGSVAAWVVGAILVGALLVGLSRSVRRASTLGPGPAVDAVQAATLSVGRLLLLLAVLAAASLTQRSFGWAGSSASAVGTIGIAALLIVMLAETRWPRQSGPVGVVPLSRATLREIVRARYLVGSATTVGLTALAAWFFVLIDPTAGSNRSSVFSTPGRSIFGSGTAGGLNAAASNCSHCALAVAAPPSAAGVWFDCMLLGTTVLVGAVALRQILLRRNVADAGTELDAALRRLSAHRVLRIVTATALGTVVAWAADLRGVLNRPRDLSTPMSDALLTFLGTVIGVCVAGLFVLYVVGPTARTLRRIGPSPVGPTTP